MGVDRVPVGSPIEVLARELYTDTLEDIFAERRVGQGDAGAMLRETRAARDRRIVEFGAFVKAHGCLIPLCCSSR